VCERHTRLLLTTPGRLSDFEEAGCAHAAANTHCHDDVFESAAFAFDQRVHGHARAAHAVRMTDRNRAAVDVEAIVRNAQRVAAVHGLHRERLVELPQSDVVDLEPVLLEQLRHRKHRTDAHLARLAAGDREAATNCRR